MTHWVLIVFAVIGLAADVRAQEFGANDGASGSADSIGRAGDGALDRSVGGVGAAADRAANVDGEFDEDDEDTEAVNRTFNESADGRTGLGSPEGTLQESSAIVNDVLE